MLLDYSGGVHGKGLGQPFYSFEQNSQQRMNLCARLLWEASCAWWRVPVLPGPVGEGQPLCQATQMIPSAWWPLVLGLNTHGCHLGTLGSRECEIHTNIVVCSCRLEVLTNPGNTCLLPGCPAPGEGLLWVAAVWTAGTSLYWCLTAQTLCSMKLSPDRHQLLLR